MDVNQVWACCSTSRYCTCAMASGGRVAAYEDSDGAAAAAPSPKRDPPIRRAGSRPAPLGDQVVVSYPTIRGVTKMINSFLSSLAMWFRKSHCTPGIRLK